MTAHGSGARLQELAAKEPRLYSAEWFELEELRKRSGAANGPAAWRGFARPLTLEVFVPVRCRRPDGKHMWPSDWLLGRGFDTASFACEFVGQAGSRVIAGRVTL